MGKNKVPVFPQTYSLPSQVESGVLNGKTEFAEHREPDFEPGPIPDIGERDSCPLQVLLAGPRIKLTQARFTGENPIKQRTYRGSTQTWKFHSQGK